MGNRKLQEDSKPAWFDLYRRAQDAGIGLDLATSPDNVEFLVRHLHPEGLIVRSTSVKTREQADEMVANAGKWCGSHLGRK